MDTRTPEEIRASPILGDVLPLRAYPRGTPLAQITEFEVWDGKRWIWSRDAGQEVYIIEAPGDAPPA